MYGLKTSDLPLSAWEEESRNDISSVIAADNFPCIFAGKANQRRTISWLFCDSAHNNRSIFLEGVVKYTSFIKATQAQDRILCPLIVVIKQEKTTLKEQHKLAWSYIQYLIDNDTEQWLSDIPLDPNNHKWCLCFNGVQLFVNISASEHKVLKSRNLGKNTCLVINPREIFDYVAPLSRPKGVKIRDKIRQRVVDYNNENYPKELGFFGDKNNLEWKQYQLSEEGALVNVICPLKLASKVVDK